MSASESRLELTVNPDASNLGVVRGFAAAVGALFGLDPERIEDLKVGLSEAVSGAISASTHTGSESAIHIVLLLSRGSVVAEVTAESGLHTAPQWDPEAPTEQFQRAIGQELLRSLFDDAIWQESESGLLVRFSLGLGEPGGEAASVS